ncbi:MAG TPA: serine/threonine-protein kinase [Gemmataceae bacterium]|jgi:serine/threonine protein kinase
MASSEQKQKDLLQDSIPPTKPTEAFEGRPGESSATAPDVPLSSSQESFEMLAPGRMLGHYRILERLGAGGMGQVYKAVHPVMERTVALKIISPKLMQESSARARFQREVRHAARLIHPNIVVAHDAAEVDGLWFLVMEYIEGRDIAQLLSRYGRPSVAMACEIIRQAALGLQYAHEHGMVHRDIKPANLMVTSARPRSGDSSVQGWPEAPLVKILDFGLARLSVSENAGAGTGETLTREGCIVGTPEYMAPEQARDSRVVDIRSDIYSLGCTLYMMLAGRPPFKAASSFEMAVMHLNQLPDPVARYNPNLPPEMSAVVHRMLAKKPDDRFQTPGAIANALLPWARLVAANPAAGSAPVVTPVPVPQSSSGVSSATSLIVSPDSGRGSAAVPPNSAAMSATSSATSMISRSAHQEPAMPPSVWMMHFQVLLRTFILFIIFAAIGIGCVIYLPDIGNQLQQLWQRVTMQAPKTTQSR